ncbi:MAG: efflux RND transporter periplasmic adaptor subunit [Pseudomonadota bacterium]
MNKSNKRGWMIAAVFLVVVAAAYSMWQKPRQAQQERYKTQLAERGEIVQSVSANGTLSPVVLVNVGTQISGTVKALYADFNQRVEAGDVLVELDPDLIRAQIRQGEANLQSAEANLKLAQVKRDRARTLLQEKFVTATQLDEAEQMLEAAQAQVEQARAQLERERTNLRYSVIRSPISGVVVARNIDLGQTVAASFQTPTLFQIAKDLREMQMDTSIAEADIGMIRIGQTAQFTVSAFPDMQFSGRVKQIRLNPTIQQNVVTYNVVVAVDNAEGRLMPGMTAYVKIVSARRDDALRIPNIALRYRPEGAAKGAQPTVYKLEADKPVAVAIKPGLSDSNYTEVLEGAIKPGDKLVTGETAAKKEGSGGFRFRMF